MQVGRMRLGGSTTIQLTQCINSIFGNLKGLRVIAGFFINLISQVTELTMRSLILLIFFFASCSSNFDAKEVLTSAEYEKRLMQVAPFVIKKPDHIQYEQRTRPENKPFYENFIQLTSASLKFYQRTDTAHFFFFEHRDLSSLYEHYRGLGGYFRCNEQDSLMFINLLYHTPRLRREEMNTRSHQLFEQMATKGNVKKYLGNRNYVDVPNDDFYYNTRQMRWDYTPNSSWRFLEDVKNQKPDITN